MERYLLDTNACIGWIKNHPGITQNIVKAGKGNILICGTVKSELWYGACKSSRREANQTLLREFFTALPSLEFNDAVVEAFGDIRFQLEKIGQPIGPFDTQIAAFARAHHCILVTHNTNEFNRVPGLRIEDWETNI